MNWITYQEAAAINNVSVLTICKAVQDHNIKIMARQGRLYLDKDQLDMCTFAPLREVVKTNLVKYSHYYYWREATPQASLNEAQRKFISMYGVREERLAK